jgi:uncharacterized protein
MPRLRSHPLPVVPRTVALRQRKEVATLNAMSAMRARVRKDRPAPRSAGTKKTGLTKAAILKTLRAHDEDLKRFSVRRIALFGSYARNGQTEKSDIDLIVEFADPTYDNFYDLSVYLERLFARKVDILTPTAIDSIRVREVAESIRQSLVYV